MRRSIVLVLVLLTAFAAGASAAVVQLTELPVTNDGVTNTGALNYTVQGLTDDGAYVTASKTNVTMGIHKIAFIKVSDGTVTYIDDATGRVTGGRGIAYTTVGGSYQLAGAGCAETNVVARPEGLAVSAGAAGSVYQNPNSEEQVANNNAMALNPATGDGWLVGQRDPIKAAQGISWKVTGGVVAMNPTWQRGQVDGWAGVSVAGIAVGANGTSPRLADVTVGTNNAYNIPAFPNGVAAGSQGNGISNNAAGTTTGFATGYFKTAAGSSDALHAFRYALGAAASVELMPAGGDDPSVAQQTNGFDVSDNGTVAGFSYNSLDGQGNLIAGYRAAIWRPGRTTPTLLDDFLAANGVGLGDFRYLERCISITADGTTIAGRGVLDADGSYRGFVVTLPEPATLAFLALGGLAMLRRRR